MTKRQKDKQIIISQPIKRPVFSVAMLNVLLLETCSRH